MLSRSLVENKLSSLRQTKFILFLDQTCFFTLQNICAQICSWQPWQVIWVIESQFVLVVDYDVFNAVHLWSDRPRLISKPSVNWVIVAVVFCIMTVLLILPAALTLFLFMQLIFESFARYLVEHKGYDKDLLNLTPATWDFWWVSSSFPILKGICDIKSIMSTIMISTDVTV